MSPVRVVWRRTLGMARTAYATSFAVAGFLSASAVVLSFNLTAAEGGRLPLAAIWAISVSPALPILAAALAMDVWSGERQSGRLQALLTAPVRERDLVLGKFFGVWTVLEIALLTSLAASLTALWALAPQALLGVRLVGFLPGFFILSLQGALWCAVASTASALTRHGAIAAIASSAVTFALPRCLWAALMAWSPEGRPAFGEMPLDAHVLDFASGVVSSGVALGYLVLTAVALFVASKAVSAARLIGKGALGLRFSTVAACILSLVFGALAVLLIARLDRTVDLPVVGGREFSPRTRQILAEADGSVRITAYVPRNAPEFRPVAHSLRQFRRAAESVGGVRIELSFVDPRWDIGQSERLVRAGVTGYGLVFEKGRRLVSSPLADGYGERLCASVIQRLTAPPQRRSVYWSVGHGEIAFDDYGPFGMSDIARDLSREGYRNYRLDFAAGVSIPGDCALIVVAGAKSDFSRAELDRLDAYLKQGGRLLALMNDAEQGGVVPLLPSWGARPLGVPLRGAQTLSGSDVVVSEFSGHAVAAMLKGSRIVLERPVTFSPSAVVGSGTGADSIGFSSVAKVGDQTVVAALERGMGTGRDLAIRPTRIVIAGDASFALNGSLSTRANSNRDFFLNCVAYLAGADSSNASGAEVDILVLGLDRGGRIRLLAHLAAGFPLVVFLLLVSVTFARRRKS